MKRCGNCGLEKGVELFSKNVCTKDGLQSNCKLCASEIKKEWRRNNKERVRDYSQNYQVANRERLIAKSRTWRENNLERARQNEKAWRDANPDKMRELVREWRKANPEKMREIDRKWRETNPESKRESKLRRRARTFENGIYFVSKSFTQRLYSSPCVYCGSHDDIQADHVIPVSRGGVHSMGNLVPACAYCNRSKADKTIMEWKIQKLRARA